MDVALRDLELLDALGEVETLTAAAERLHVSQPALSQRLTKLERSLGTPLFDRRGRRLVLNAAGRRMLVAARHVLAELDAAGRDLRDLSDRSRSLLRLTSQCSTTFQWLPGVVRRYRDSYPGVEVRIEPVARDDSLGALLDGLVDVALVTKSDPRMDRVALVPVFDDVMVALVAAGHPWAGRHHLTARDFDHAHVLVYDVYDPARVPFVPLPVPAGSRPARVTPVPMIPDLLAEMVASGEGVSVVPSWEADRLARTHDVRAVQIGTRPLVRSWFCATRRGPRLDHVEGFVDELATSLAASAPGG